MRKTKNNYVPAEYGGYLFPKSCLPEILPGDHGKVLTVNNSETEAEWAQAQGGSNIFWIEAEEIDMGDGTYVYKLNKTFIEIHTAMLSRSLCVIAWAESGAPGYAARQDVVTEVGYGRISHVYSVFAGAAEYKATTINDYPEVVD